MSATTQSNSMDSLIISSLSNSFKQIPLPAIPPIIDCILTSTGLSPSSLFSSLLASLPNILKDPTKEDHKLDSDQCDVISMVYAVCHLLKKLGTNPDAMQLFIWKCFIPLMNMVHELEILNEIAESFFDVVRMTNCWGILEATLVPFFLRSVGLFMGMLQNEESDVFEWNQSSVFQEFDDLINHFKLDKEAILYLSTSFPLPTSCHILTLVLDAALQSFQAASTTELMLENGSYQTENLLISLLWDLCNVSERLLSQSLEHRSCCINFFLPIIFKTFVSHYSSEISVHGATCILSRDFFFRKIWKCCRSLFSLGPLERRDAYNVLSLYLSFFSYAEGDTDANARTEEFDIQAEREFWDEIKRGLIDDDGLVRKQSLHILKKVLQLSGESQFHSCISENKSREKHSVPRIMTKRELWADKEAKSLGVGKFCNAADSPLNRQQQWEAFLLLYEMLQEYGTHLVEAAWNHQMTLLLQFSVSNDSFASSNYGDIHKDQIETLSTPFSWLAILWQLGFRHDNPQVRCLIMQSFFGIEWMQYGDSAKSVPESFVLGALIEGLNDPVHHRDFGIKGVYTSRTIEGAAWFFYHYTSSLNARKGIAFLHSLASVAKRQSFGRAGLMCLAECIASAASGVQACDDSNGECRRGAFCDGDQMESSLNKNHCNDMTNLLDILRFVIESSKQHFNPNFRLRVCEKVLEAAATVVSPFNVPLEVLLHFISTLPREFTDYGGSLRVKMQEWLLGCTKKHRGATCSSTDIQLMTSLQNFPESFTRSQYMPDALVTFDDEDLNAWESEAKRWARVLLFIIEGEHQLAPILMFIQNCGVNICKQYDCVNWLPVKFLILTMSLVSELQIMQEKSSACGNKIRFHTDIKLLETGDLLGYAEASKIYEEVSDLLLSILEELVSFANMSCSIFLPSIVKDTTLPNYVRGKLGGRSQRRLSSSTTTAVLQAITSMQAVASISSWCAQFKSDARLSSVWAFLWAFFWQTVSSPTCDSETAAEICLAAYEALAPVLRTLVVTFSPVALDLIRENDKLSPPEEVQPWLDSLVLSFLQHINNLLGVGVLARTRRALLLDWKWLCLECILSIPHYVLGNDLLLEDGNTFFSDKAARCIFSDLVENLENAGEGSILPLLRSVRLALGLFASGKSGSLVSSCSGVDVQMMWQLVRSSWILHVSSNKRRVASIAALLSSVLHTSVFIDEEMHFTDNAPGPLKWFVENVLEEGTKSPRTIRLAALHLTGLWISHPRTIKYYIKELKLLTLYGSVAFDEDFEGELADNHDARTEVTLLAKSPDPELTEVFINTELYARVSVAVLFYKLADLVGSTNENDDRHDAFESGKLFLLDLLHSVVNDKDLAKELYKKYSGIHRRKIRAWQMICVLSRYVTNDIVGQVTDSLHTSLYRNNLPAVRQYLETFAISIYLKFPSLVREQLVPMLRDHKMRPQALSSYVFIAANVILHASAAVKSRHLDDLLPAIIPLLTSHHHSLRGFTQLLVYQVFCKYFPHLDSGAYETMPLEKRGFKDLKSYLEKNPDCERLRASMEGYLDAYNPIISSTPSGIFVNRVEALEFECVPKSLMEEVLSFLNDVREDLRCSMAKDVVTIKNESLKIDDANISGVLPGAQLPREISLDFQKKITLSKHEKKGAKSNSLLGNNETHKQLLEMEKEDELLDQSFQSRSLMMERIRESRQHFILVASFLDRIPNLAGLARTCEVFKASGLAVADSSIVRDKQFQLISVTAEKWVPIIEVPVNSVNNFLEKKKREGFSILGLEQTANSMPLDQYIFPKKTVLVLGREKEGIPVDIIHILDACIEIPQLGVVRSLNVHVSGAIALWEYTRQQRSQ